MAENEKSVITGVIPKLVHCFLSGSLKFTLTPAEINELSWIGQEKLIKSTIHNPIFKKYPLRQDFCRLFIKKIIQYLEPYQEIHDDIFEFLCTQMKSKFDKDNLFYRHTIVNNDISNIITIKETNNMVVNGTTGMKTWEAAIILSDWILGNKELFHNKKVLELGSGVGFTGITLGKFCTPKSVMMTDCHIDVLKVLIENIAINFPKFEKKETSQCTCFRSEDKEIGVMMLDWNCIKDINDGQNPDIIIGADIVYDPSILQPLCNVLETFFKRNPNVQIYIASIIRNEETFSSFLNILGRINVAVEKHVPTECMYLKWDQEMPRCLLKINRN
ncbi:unnamed protein product [Parnassius mnemosyne]|uniref:FAM86 N-terminal domain-containing protein n=1 Tax=Parnassius mnemosyne TaxID=213953 RepID=A0AAV1KFB9_9NEOP